MNFFNYLVTEIFATAFELQTLALYDIIVQVRKQIFSYVDANVTSTRTKHSFCYKKSSYPEKSSYVMETETTSWICGVLRSIVRL